MAEIITRKDALDRGLDRYFTGKPCKRGHTGGRRTSCGDCIQCSLDKSREVYRADPEAHKAYTKKWREKNPLQQWAIAQRQKRAQIDKRHSKP